MAAKKSSKRKTFVSKPKPDAEPKAEATPNKSAELQASEPPKKPAPPAAAKASSDDTLHADRVEWLENLVMRRSSTRALRKRLEFQRLPSYLDALRIRMAMRKDRAELAEVKSYCDEYLTDPRQFAQARQSPPRG